MPVGQPTSSTPTYLGRVITCDPTQRIVEVVLNASGQRLQIMTTPVCARWPVVGETWTVCFVNNTPYLGELYQTYQAGSNSSQTGIEEIPAGDAWINSPTGVLHIIGSPNGSTDFTLNKMTGAAWIVPTLTNSWTTRAGDPAGYLKDPFGFVHLRGRFATTGASGTSAFVLPTGYKPGNTDDLYAAGGYNGTTSAIAAWANILRSNGVVNLFYATGATDVGLGGITFLAEN